MAEKLKKRNEIHQATDSRSSTDLKIKKKEIHTWSHQSEATGN